MALATQNDLEKHLQITFGTQPSDPVVADYLDQAQAIADAYCQQPLEEGTVTAEKFEVDQWDPWYRTDRFPISAVSAVSSQGDALVNDEDFRWYPDGRLRRISADGYEKSWSTLVDDNSITYTAGYGGTITTPRDLVLAVTMIAAGLFQNGARYAADGAKGIKSVSLEGSDSIEYEVVPAVDAAAGFQIPTGAKPLLGPYRRIKLG